MDNISYTDLRKKHFPLKINELRKLDAEMTNVFGYIIVTSGNRRVEFESDNYFKDHKSANLMIKGLDAIQKAKEVVDTAISNMIETGLMI